MKYEFVYRDKLSEEELSDLLNMKYRNRLGVLVHFIDQITISPQEKGDWIDCMAAEGVTFPSKKFEAFNWNVICINGHDLDAIEAAATAAKACKGKPTAVICSCIKGKGVSFMENKVGWHGKAPNDDEYAQAVAELTAKKN